MSAGVSCCSATCAIHVTMNALFRDEVQRTSEEFWATALGQEGTSCPTVVDAERTRSGGIYPAAFGLDRKRIRYGISTTPAITDRRVSHVTTMMRG